MQTHQTVHRGPSILHDLRRLTSILFKPISFGALAALLICLPTHDLAGTPAPEDPPSSESPPPSESDTTAPSNSPQRITMSLRDADLVEVLRSFAKIGNFNLILDPAVRGKVTVELRDVPWDAALEQILKVQGLGIDAVGGHRLVGSPTALNRQRVQLLAVRRVELRLQHLDATRVAAVLRRPGSGLLSPLGSAQALGDRALVLEDTGLQLMELGPVLQQLDRPEAAQEDPGALARRADLAWERRLASP